MKSWTLKHRAWVASQHLGDALAQLALEMLIHLDGVDRRLPTLDSSTQ